MTGTQEQAEEHEYAWRYKAFQKGWKIYAKPPGIVIRNPLKRTDGYRKSLAAGYTWPAHAPAVSAFSGMTSGGRGLAWTVFKWWFVYPGILCLVLLALGLGR